MSEALSLQVLVSVDAQPPPCYPVQREWPLFCVILQQEEGVLVELVGKGWQRQSELEKGNFRGSDEGNEGSPSPS